MMDLPTFIVRHARPVREEAAAKAEAPQGEIELAKATKPEPGANGAARSA